MRSWVYSDHNCKAVAVSMNHLLSAPQMKLNPYTFCFYHLDPLYYYIRDRIPIYRDLKPIRTQRSKRRSEGPRIKRVVTPFREESTVLAVEIWSVGNGGCDRSAFATVWLASGLTPSPAAIRLALNSVKRPFKRHKFV